MTKNLNNVKKEKGKDGRIRLFLIALFCTMAILQSGLRDVNNLPAGNDTPNYLYSYERTRNTTWSSLWSEFSFIGSEYSERDAGYPIFVKLTQVLWTDFTFFMFLTAFLFIAPFGLLIRRYVKTNLGVILSFLIYFALFTNIVNSFMRQAVTLGIFLFALRYVVEQKWKQYYALIALAITLHTSAIAVAPFYFIPKLKIKRDWLLLMLVLVPFLIFYTKSFLSSLIGGTVYENYLDAETENPLNYALFVIGVSLFTYLSYNNLKTTSNQLLISGVVGSLLILPIAFLGNTMLRVSFYYVLLLIPLIAVLIDNIKMRHDTRLGVYVCSICFFLYFIFR